MSHAHVTPDSLAVATEATAAPCALCADGAVEEFFVLPGVAATCNRLYASRSDAMAAARGDLRLVFCPSCGYIYNRAFRPAAAAYEPGYENALQYSQRFRRYARALANWLIDQADLHDKEIVEIGCGDGFFLNELCRQGRNRGTGFDPAYVPRPGLDESPAVRFRREYYPPKSGHQLADLLCCRQVLEHLPDPLAFLQQVRQSVRSPDAAALFIGVPNALPMLKGLALWDLLYEHRSYFLPDTLVRLLIRSGFSPAMVRVTYGGQYLAVLALPSGSFPVDVAARRPGVQTARLVGAFAGLFARRLEQWQKRLEEYRRLDKRVVFWGAGTKGVVLLNALSGAEELVECVVDVNPRKQGLFVPLCAHEVVAPESLRAWPPKVVVVMNALYRREVRQKLEELAIHADVVTA
ncbi:MAG: class I SAM-dependent methyltransferase [Planctomycetaceae bacterium]|nr:class I SAM-dependent methyltransferase [Planctomycetaceae bacterium]